MINPGANRQQVRIRTLNQELRKTFGCRVHKVPVDAGMTCPNRDGDLGTGGCTYCGPSGSSGAWKDSEKGIAEQMTEGMALAGKRFHASRFIAYFQTFTNTYAPADTLRRLWDEALGPKHVVGLAVGTRPDCLPDDILDLFQSYTQRLPYTCLEIGLQSIHDKTLKRIRRGHDSACFRDALERAQTRGIPVCVHIILGLPGESVPEMLETVNVLLDLGVEGIKLHHLHVLKGAPLEQDYLQRKVRVFKMDEYVHLVCEILRLINGRMVIHRFMGEAQTRELIAPLWMGRKKAILSAIFDEIGEDSV